MLELDVALAAPQVLEMCSRHGLVVRSERELAGRPGSRHRHLRRPDRPGTLELNEWQGRVWVKVHPRRDGGWATAFAHELADEQPAAVVEREDIDVMFKRAADEQQSITRAWAELAPAVYGLIAPAFEKLARRSDHDCRRPGIEFYRRRDAIDLLSLA